MKMVGYVRSGDLEEPEDTEYYLVNLDSSSVYNVLDKAGRWSDKRDLDLAVWMTLAAIEERIMGKRTLFVREVSS
jgi:hypothetical protein